MANGIYERGEMYDILSGEAMFGELASHRPGIIISSEIGNQTSSFVTMVYCTTATTRELSVNHRFTMRGIEQLALCSQIVTVSKKRLSKFYGKLNDSDMKAVDRCVRQALGFEDVELTALKVSERVIAEKNAEIEALKSKVAEVEAKVENAELSCKVENAMWQKLYEKALGQVVDMKYANDLSSRAVNKEVKAPAPPKEEPVLKTPESVEDDGKVDINHCTITALKKVGFSMAMAKLIVSRRPYNAVADLKSVPGLKASQYRVIEPKLRCTKVETPVKKEPDPGFEKVNVNTASAQEIADALGIGVTCCYAITGKRKREGAFTSLEQIVVPKRFTEGMLEKYRHLLEV